MNKLITLMVSCFLCFSVNVHAQSKGKVLVVMSNADKMELKGGKSVPVGFFLNEFAVPVQEIINAGYEVVVATPQGKKPTMDASSKDPLFFGGDQKKRDEALKLTEKVLNKKNVKKLKSVANENIDQYVGIFVPGGHAPIVDLAQDQNLGKILKHFHEKAKPTAMICHGPIVVLSTLDNPEKFIKAMKTADLEGAKKQANNWIYQDYKMTIFSNDEEKKAEKDKLKGNMEFYVADALEQAGANVKNEGVEEVNVIEDRELITGQNPKSDHDTGKALVKALDNASNK